LKLKSKQEKERIQMSKVKLIDLRNNHCLSEIDTLEQKKVNGGFLGGLAKVVLGTMQKPQTPTIKIDADNFGRDTKIRGNNNVANYIGGTIGAPAAPTGGVPAQ
jgi:hypothetical protein